MLSIILSTLETKEQQSKFENIYYKYNKGMLSIAYKILKNPTEAEEVLYDAFFAIANNIDKIKTDDELLLKSYLYKVVKNLSIDFLRKKSKNPIIEELSVIEDVSKSENLADSIAGDEQYKRIVSKIISLPSAYRDVLIFHLIHELTPKEISVLLKRKLSTVKSQISRGKKMLQNILEEEKIK